MNLCRSYAALSSCVSEEEKSLFRCISTYSTITKLIQSLEDDVYSYVHLVLDFEGRIPRRFTAQSDHLPAVVAMLCCRGMKWL